MKFRTARQLRDDVLAIWKAGVAGVQVDRLMRDHVSVLGGKTASDEQILQIGGVEYPLGDIDRIVVVGGGKASGAMAQTLEAILRPLFDSKEILGWVNVPEGCDVPLERIKLFPARPLGVNEPTEAAVEGTGEIIRLLQSLGPKDLCVNLLSGGGSALLAAPIPGISLSEKLELTRFLSESGASIRQLNAVRKQISRIKGGGMKAMCRGKQLISLILSDVLGDPLDVIASGPTTDDSVTAASALDVLNAFMSSDRRSLPESRRTALLRIVRYLEEKAETETEGRERVCENNTPTGRLEVQYDSLGGFVHNIVIGNNATAVEAAGEEALARGYSFAMYSAPQSEPTAEEVGEKLVRLALEMRVAGPDCLIHGGEPVVQLVPENVRGRGGRNQQLILSALVYLLEHPEVLDDFDPEAPIAGQDGSPIGLAILSGGTDGEDGPTDAAGALLDPIVWKELRRRMNEEPDFRPRPFLEQNNAYPLFRSLNALVKTGITRTNVCDLRIIVVARVASEQDPSG